MDACICMRQLWRSRNLLIGTFPPTWLSQSHTMWVLFLSTDERSTEVKIYKDAAEMKVLQKNVHDCFQKMCKCWQKYVATNLKTMTCKIWKSDPILNFLKLPQTLKGTSRNLPTWKNIPENSILHGHYCENLKSTNLCYRHFLTCVMTSDIQICLPFHHSI
jgi:hypothetical protein